MFVRHLGFKKFFCTAAVSALARFGAECENLLPSILSLLTHSMLDEDDEVRDRATFYYHVLNQKQKALNSAYILNGKCWMFVLTYRGVLQQV